MPPTPARFLDPTTGDWIFDASPLIHADEASGMLFKLMTGFKGRAHIAEDVLRELDKGGTGQKVRWAKWFREEKLVLAGDAATRYAEVRSRYGRGPDRDRGEAASLVIAEGLGLTLAVDDGVAYRQACEMSIRCTRTPQLIVTMVRAGWWTSNEAWLAYQALMASGDARIGPIPWNDRAAFNALCAVTGYDG